jgi:hypothetical protein
MRHVSAVQLKAKPHTLGFREVSCNVKDYFPLRFCLKNISEAIVTNEPAMIPEITVAVTPNGVESLIDERRRIAPTTR